MAGQVISCNASRPTGLTRWRSNPAFFGMLVVCGLPADVVRLLPTNQRNTTIHRSLFTPQFKPGFRVYAMTFFAILTV